jgi:hypothetical protein
LGSKNSDWSHGGRFLKVVQPCCVERVFSGFLDFPVSEAVNCPGQGLILSWNDFLNFIDAGFLGIDPQTSYRRIILEDFPE